MLFSHFNDSEGTSNDGLVEQTYDKAGYYLRHAFEVSVSDSISSSMFGQMPIMQTVWHILMGNSIASGFFDLFFVFL